MTTEQAAQRVDRLLDAIDLLKAGEREAARQILRQLIQEDSQSEDAWLWLSVAVDNADQSAICLDHVLRINPNNLAAAGAYYRLQALEIATETRRSRLRFWRDTTLGLFWFLVMGLLFIMVYVFSTPEWWVNSVTP